MRFDTRGVVLVPADLTLAEWPERAAQAGLNTIALHAPQQLDELATFIRGDAGSDAGSDAGQQFLAGCQRLNLRVEYALHAMSDLLPRELFEKDVTMFRVDQTGQRTPAFNCCPSSPHALEIISARAVEYARLFRPTTHRFFYWPDDGREWCRCDQCRGLSHSEQALLV
ncbi:MAG: hypothetical protein M1546_09060, partial [Chloroflexi bacterium]|nr:hypothetical protein [Chloroflexota bacterium]